MAYDDDDYSQQSVVIVDADNNYNQPGGGLVRPGTGRTGDPTGR